MDFSFSTILTLWIPNTLSIIACTIVFGVYHKLPKKTLSARMILVLIASNFLSNSAVILYSAFPVIHSIKSWSTVTRVMAIFSMFWVCNIGYFVYQLLTLKRMPSLKSHLCVPLTVLLSLSITSLLIFQYCLNNIGKISSCISLTMPTIASGVVILMIYYKGVELLTLNSDKALEALQLTPKDLHIYLYVAIFTIVASILYYMYIMLKVVFTNADLTTWRDISYFIYDLSGFINSFVYLWQSKDDGKATKMEKLEYLAIERSDSINNMLCREVKNLSMSTLGLDINVEE